MGKFTAGNSRDLKLVVFIRVGPWQHAPYESPARSFVQGRGGLWAEMDSESTGEVTRGIQQLLQDADQLFIWFQLQSTVLGSAQSLIHPLFALSPKIAGIALAGRHESLEKMLRPLGSERLLVNAPEEEIFRQLTIFLQGEKSDGNPGIK